MRKELFEHQEDVVGRVARVATQQVFASGKLRAPAFKNFHLDKNAALYHGSPQRLEMLEPRDEHGDPRVKPAVFATPDHTFALAYTGRKWGDRDINQEVRGGPRGPRMILREMRPGALQDTYGGQTGYIYHLPEETFSQLQGRRTSKEVVSYRPVTPNKIEEIKDALEALKGNTSVELASYDPRSPAVRTALRRQVSRMLEMSPEDQEGYKKWRLEPATPEMRQMWEKEVGQQKKASVMMSALRRELNRIGHG
jgi:hypothetical protein